MPNTLNIENPTNRLVIEEDDVILRIENSNITVVSVAEQGPQGIQGIQGPPGAAGGLQAVQDDPNPVLGGDLTLGTYNIIGQLENTTLILDGGLL